jgi:4-hydroxythreonine-4-phosphate dehydrogenase
VSGSRARIAVTLGDPRGIGAEVAAAVLADHSLAAEAELVPVGPEGLLAHPSLVKVGQWTPEGGAPEAGRLAGEAVRRAVEMALAGEVAAIVTAPIDKAAFHAGGWHYPGHTEMLQALGGSGPVGMLMAAERTVASGGLRVLLATTHLALRDVPAAVTARLLVEQTRLADRALREWWGIEAPRIALCAFNPHASDGGLFGDEEERLYAPALRELGAGGVVVTGPVPADTVFSRALRGEFDVVVAPYHDVGMAAFKTVAFGSGVNVTLGLPFPRTSPDHGTALDIAGRGVADPASMFEAVRLAIRLARRQRAPRLGGARRENGNPETTAPPE